MDKIICVGKNYLAHAKEFGEAVPDKPVLFLKPSSVLKQSLTWHEPLTIQFPLDDDVHPECEIALLLNRSGYQLSREQAMLSISAVTLGLDMTLRTRQAQLKKNGHPWTTAKVFPDAAVLAPWLAVTDFPHYMDTPFSLRVNGELRQQAWGNDMMMHPIDLLIYISHYFPLCAGDVIFTGTPAGVAAVTPNDLMSLNWGDKGLTIKFNP